MILDENNVYKISFEKSGFKIFSIEEFINLGDKIPDILKEKVYTIIWSGTKRFTHIVNGINYIMPKNSFLYINPNVKQKFTKQISKTDGYLLLFKEDFYARTLTESINLQNSKLFCITNIGPIKNTICTEQIFKNTYLKHIFPKTLTDLEKRLQRNIIERIIISGLQSLNSLEKDLKHEDYDVLIATKFFDLLQHNVHQEKLVLFYTDRLFVTKRRLDKATLKVYNKTAKEMIIDELIKKSKILLSHTSKSIKDIAIELNFLQETNFTAFFKKHVGFSPTIFRQNTPN